MDWTAPDDWQTIETIDAHTGGEPLRVIVDEAVDLQGETMLEKQRYVRKHYDHLRTMLMWEPRGHADMYGAILTDPVSDDSDLGVLFTHNDGYSSMCGHGIIALGVVLPELGLVSGRNEGAPIQIDTPAGKVTAIPRVDDYGRIRRVAFENVPSFVVSLDNEVDVPSIGTVMYDLAFGGAYYAYCNADQFGISLDTNATSDLIEIGRDVKAAVADTISIEHPLEDDLGFLYGVIFTEESTSESDVRNVCVFADGEIDRSPTGTGVSGHLAVQHARGRLGTGDPYVVDSIIESTFTGRIREIVDYHGHEAVIPEVEGEAHITGANTFVLDPADPFPEGFLLR